MKSFLLWLRGGVPFRANTHQRESAVNAAQAGGTIILDKQVFYCHRDNSCPSCRECAIVAPKSKHTSANLYVAIIFQLRPFSHITQTRKTGDGFSIFISPSFPPTPLDFWSTKVLAESTVFTSDISCFHHFLVLLVGSIIPRRRHHTASGPFFSTNHQHVYRDHPLAFLRPPHSLMGVLPPLQGRASPGPGLLQ